MTITAGIDVPEGVRLDRLTVAKDDVDVQLARRSAGWEIDTRWHTLPYGVRDHYDTGYDDVADAISAARELCTALARWRDARDVADANLVQDLGFWKGAHGVPDPTPQQGDTASTGVAADSGA